MIVTKNFRRAALLGATASASLFAAAGAHAAGFYLQEQSTKAIGRAFSGEAADQGAESLWWNPAAIAGNASSSAYVSASGIFPSTKVSNSGTLIQRPSDATFVPVTGDQVSKNPIKNGVLPSGGVAYKLNDEFSVGLAVTSPYSFETNYAATSWARYSADKTKLTTIDLQPTIAFAPSPLFGIGIGLNVEHSKATLSNAVPNYSVLQPDGEETLEGKGWDFGWSAGIQIHPSKLLDLGFSYKSSIKHKLKGDVTFAGVLAPLAPTFVQNGSINTDATFRTPWQATASARIHASDALTIDGSVSRIGWSKFDAIDLGAPLSVAIPEGYKSSWSYGAGLDYAVTQKWTMRAGVQRDETPTKDGARDARVPDADRWNFSAGTSYKISDGLTLDAAAMYTSFSKEGIDRPTQVVGTTILPNGEVAGHALIGSLGARMSF